MNIDSITQVDDNVTKKEDMPMKNASQLNYNIIDEYKDFLQNTGTCVIDNFIGMYGEELGITRKYFKCLVKNITNNLILIGLLMMVFLPDV